MAKDCAAPPFYSLRRTDRAVEAEAWIRALLHRAPVGSLATVYLLRIEQWSGKAKSVGPDLPGAFHYGQPPAGTFGER